jgi:hypothetical protein
MQLVQLVALLIQSKQGYEQFRHYDPDRNVEFTQLIQIVEAI